MEELERTGLFFLPSHLCWLWWEKIFLEKKIERLAEQSN